MDDNGNLLRTADIASAYLKKNNVKSGDIPLLIHSIFSSLSRLDPASPAPLKKEPAVSIKKSITPDYLICLEDGHRVKMLKRYLRTQFNLTPEEYRRKWDLPFDYPMAAPNYTAARTRHALAVGFGRKNGRGR